MATSIRTILHITSQRSDLVRFYRDGLGLGDPEHSSGEESFRFGDLTLAVSPGDGRIHAPVPRTALTFAVDDLEEKIEHLKALGMPFDLEPSNGSSARRAICRDPDGNFVILLSGPRVARRQKDDDGRPSRKSRHKGKKGAHKAARRAAHGAAHGAAKKAPKKAAKPAKKRPKKEKKKKRR